MRKQPWAILFALLVLAGGMLYLLFSGAPVEEGRCKLFRRKADPSSPLAGLAFQWLQSQTARPEGVRDLPAGFDRPGYYLLKTAGRQVPLVMDLSQRQRPSICVDTDGDGVLARERCFPATRVRATEGSSSSLRFGPISLVAQDGSRATDSRFYVRCYRAEAGATLTTCPAFFRTGKLRLEGRTYRVAVVDGDGDGQYRSLLSLPLDRPWRIPDSDVFAIDLNGDAKFEMSLHPARPSEVMPLGQLVRIADAYYALEIAPDGMSLTLSRTEPQFGTLALEPNDMTVEMRLWSEAADQHLSHNQQWQLPAGRYKAIYAASEIKDASGDWWSFSSNLNSAFTHLGPLDFFVIRPGETTRLRIGPPFVVTADAPRAGAQVSISPVLIGCGGERYQMDFRRNGRRAPDRTFKIVDEKGNVLVADKFQYG